MNQGHVFTEDAFLLHHRSYRDTSKIVDLLTESQGIISLVAKGVRTSKKGGMLPLQPMQKIRISWSSKSSLGTLRDIDLLKTYPYIDGDKQLSVFYINEILIKIFEKYNEDKRLYQSYVNYIENISTKDWIPRLRFFEMELLKILGYYPNFELDHRGESIDMKRYYGFDNDRGFVMSQSAEIKKNLYVGKCISSIRKGDLVSKEAQALCKLIFRLFLNAQFSGIRVNTRGVMSDILRLDLGSKRS